MKKKYLAFVLLLAQLFIGISQTTANPLNLEADLPVTSSCSDFSPQNVYQRKVLILSIPDDNDSSTTRYTTDTNSTDQSLVDFLCNLNTPTLNSVSVEVFNGSDGSAPFWPDLTLYTDLVLPASTSSVKSILDDANIWSSSIANELRNWVESGGHLHLLGVYEQRDLFGDLSNYEDIDSAFSDNPRPILSPGIDTRYWAGRSDLRFSTAPGLPFELEFDLLTPLLDTETYNLMNQNNVLQRDVFFKDSGSQDGSSWSQVVAGAVPVGYGLISLYSTKLFDLTGYDAVTASISKSRWYSVIAASLAGHISNNLALKLGLEYSSVGTSVAGGDNGELLRAFDSALSVQLGDALESRTIPCINTLKNPSLIRHDALGLWLICGEFHVDDGTTEEGYEARLIRWFSKDTNWIRTTIEFNYHRHFAENTLLLGLFNDYGSDQFSNIEITNTGFPEPLPNFYYVEEDLLWFTVSADSNLTNDNLNNNYGSSSPVVLNFTPEWGTYGFGGVNTSDQDALSGLDGGGDAYIVNRSQTLIRNYLDIGGENNIKSSISWYTAILDFELGCDVNTLAVAEQVAENFVEANLGDEPYNFDLINSDITTMSSLITYGDLELPELNSECQSYEITPEFEVINLESDSAEILFDSSIGADWYELQFFNQEFQEWVPIDADWSTESGQAEMTNLNPSTTYEVRMRAWQVEGDFPNQWASHSVWVTEEFQTPAQVIQTPQPSTSSVPVYIEKPVEVIYVPKIIYVYQDAKAQGSQSNEAKHSKPQNFSQYSKIKNIMLKLLKMGL